MRLARRPFLFMLMALLTLAVQQGALRHELSHELAPRASELRDDGGAPPGTACEACIAYAAAGAALPSSAHFALPAYAPPAALISPAASLPGAAPRAYRARAPPSSRPS